MMIRWSIAIVVVSGFLFSAPAQTTNLPPLVEWYAEAEIGVSGGYRDNVLRSSIAEESSSFVMTSLDASLMRLSETGSYLMFYLFGEDIRYFNAPSVNYEQFFSAIVNGAVPVGDRDSLGFETSYFYQHQVYDASETQDIQRRLLVLAHSLALRGFWEHIFGEHWETRFEAGGARQVYEQELDDFTDADGEVFLIRNYGYRSECTVGYQFLRRMYDTRQQVDEAGFVIPGTDLVYDQHEVAGEWRHYWDKGRYWRSLSRLSGMMNRDNGSGYYDYDRILFREQLRWDNGTWAVRASARFGWYFYKIQQVGTEKRERSYITLDISVERRLGKHWALFVAGEHEWNMSNDTLDDYDSWMAHTGVRYEF